jgi:hypothetical protein
MSSRVFTNRSAALFSIFARNRGVSIKRRKY